TGIVDSHGFMMALHAEACAHGAQFVFNTPFIAGTVEQHRFVLQFGGADPGQISARCVVNATGLNAPLTACSLAGQPARHIPSAYYCKGSYYALTGKAPFSRLIYPLPDQAGLGVHLPLEMAGPAPVRPQV